MRRVRRVLFTLLVAASATSAAAEAAQPKARARAAAPASADVEVAEQLYAKLDYERANEVAEAVIGQRDLSHDQLVRAYRVLAVTSAVLDRADAARDAFFQLLVFDPDHELDTNLGPKVSTPFVEARGQLRALSARPGVDVTATVRVDGGQLRVTTRDPTRIVEKVLVGYRWTATGSYTVTALDADEGTVEVSPAVEGRTRLDFYAQALDARGSAVFEAGSPSVPKSAFAEAGARAGGGAPGADKGGRSVFASPIFWVVAGAVVGGGAAAFFALRPEHPTRAALTPELRCGPDPCQ